VIVKEFKIVSGGKCPVCRAPVNMDVHSICVVDLDDMIRRGEAELVNWTDPLPGQFRGLRKAIFVQLARGDVYVDQPGHRTRNHSDREDETVY